MTTMKIYVVRHGETELNKNKILQGRYDEALCKEGVDLAVKTGRAIKGIKFDYAFSSPLIRSVETVRLILDNSGNTGVDISTDLRLAEIDVGDWTLRDLTDATYPDFAIMKSFFADPFSQKKCPGGESVCDVMKRTQDFLKELASRNDDKTYLVGTHGMATRAMLNAFYRDRSDFWHGHVPYNCSFNILEAKDGEIKLVEEDKVFYDMPIKDYYK